MSTKKDRLEAKRRQQTADKAARLQEKKTTDENIPEKLCRIDEQIKQVQKQMDQVYRDGELAEVSLRVCDDKKYFVGPDSGGFNNRLQACRQILQKLNLTKENLLNKQNPNRAQTIHAQKSRQQAPFSHTPAVLGSSFL